ncbi:MAG: lysophospholipid acyltransferase family protein [Synergistes sp.]|nr:lysophospholipid acyltransferase family protein [Synergistes sp.]
MKFISFVIYYIVCLLLMVYFKLYHRASFYGTENIPDSAFILASNHASYLDPPVTACAFMPRKIRSIAWDGLFKFKPFGAFLKAMGAVPVSHEDKRSAAGILRLSMGIINGGDPLYICPEGHRTLDGKLSPLEGGVAILSMKTGAPILPVYVGGTYRAMSPHMIFPRPRKIFVTIGKPIYLTDLPQDMQDKEKRRLILEKISAFYEEEDAKDKAKYPLPMSVESKQ